jgi:hypothetical protein
MYIYLIDEQNTISALEVVSFMFVGDKLMVKYKDFEMYAALPEQQFCMATNTLVSGGDFTTVLGEHTRAFYMERAKAIASMRLDSLPSLTQDEINENEL